MLFPLDYSEQGFYNRRMKTKQTSDDVIVFKRSYFIKCGRLGPLARDPVKHAAAMRAAWARRKEREALAGGVK
jgi:hypothetical protein